MKTDLYSRQTRLREVGKKGQALISAARIVIGSDAAARVAAEYLTRSGVGHVEHDSSLGAERFVHAAHFTYAVTEQYARGAWIATREIGRLLGLPSKSSPDR